MCLGSCCLLVPGPWKEGKWMRLGIGLALRSKHSGRCFLCVSCCFFVADHDKAEKEERPDAGRNLDHMNKFLLGCCHRPCHLQAVQINSSRFVGTHFHVSQDVNMYIRRRGTAIIVLWLTCSILRSQLWWVNSRGQGVPSTHPFMPDPLQRKNKSRRNYQINNQDRTWVKACACIPEKIPSLGHFTSPKCWAHDFPDIPKQLNPKHVSSLVSNQISQRTIDFQQLHHGIYCLLNGLL